MAAQEATGKSWKLLIMAGSLALLVGVCWLIGLGVAGGSDSNWLPPIGLAVGGFIARLVGSMGKWFFHE